MAYKVRQTGQQVQADLDKIEGVEAGAQVNVQSDWNESDPASDAYIKNKPNSISQVQSDWSQSDTTAVDYIKNKPTIPVVPTNVSAFTNDAGYLTQHQDLSSLADGAEYDSNEKRIYLKHGNVRLGNPIDATAFIKDGMVDSVAVSNGYLVITFNTDSGKQPISIPLSDIFNANNYYTKSEVDTALGAKQDALTFDSEPTAESDNPVTSGGVYDALQDIDIESVTEVTWAELKGLRDNGELVKGSFYRITDYNCTTTQENTQSAGHQFDIVLLALSENRLAEEGWAMEHPTDVYDVTFADGVTKKCYLYFRYEEEGVMVYNVVDINTHLGTNLYYLPNETKESSIIPDEKNKTAISSYNSDALDIPDLTYSYFQNSNLSAWKVWYCLDNDTDRFAWADDSVDEDSPAILTLYNSKSVNIDCERDSSQDIEGYYAWTSGEQGTFYTNTLTPTTEDNVYNNLGDILDSWSIISYTPAHEGTGFPNGRGVIYRLIDEFNNDIKYDFKNIQFKRTITDGQYDANGDETWCYTLNLWYDNMCQDASIVGNTLLNDEGFVEGVYDNIFGYATVYNLGVERVDTFAFALGNNVILSFDDGEYFGIYSNTIGNKFYGNTIGTEFKSNTIGNCFFNNIIGNYFIGNTIGGNFYNHIIGENVEDGNYGNFDGIKLVADDDYVHTDNNYTSAEKTKLAGIASGAEVNVQSDWNQSNSSADDFIKNKPVFATVATSGSYDDLSDKPTIPDAQIQADWNQATTTAKDYIKNKPTIPTVPTNVSAFTNDAGYLNNNFCPIIEDTRSSAVAAITGVAPFSTLVGGQRVIVRLAYNTGSASTLQLTLSGGTSTDAIPIYIDSYRQTEIQLGSQHFRANDYMAIIYDSTRNVWKCLSQIDTNTTYTTLSQATINAGTEASGRVITAALFHDNAYIVEESYSSGSLKANKMYDFGEVTTALVLPDLDVTNDLVSNAMNFWALHFKVGELTPAGTTELSITFPQNPSGIIVDDEPTIKEGDYVEIMITKHTVGNDTDYYASIKVWQAQQ